MASEPWSVCAHPSCSRNYDARQLCWFSFRCERACIQEFFSAPRVALTPRRHPPTRPTAGTQSAIPSYGSESRLSGGGGGGIS